MLIRSLMADLLVLHLQALARPTLPKKLPLKLPFPKRKRSSPSKVSSSVPEGAEQRKTARPAPNIGQDDHLVRPAPSPDQDDHLPIKKLKT